MQEMTIRQVSERTGLSEYALRYYERVGLISNISRASNGHRRYSENDVSSIIFLTCLRSAGMPISDMKQYVDLQRQGDSDSTISRRLALLVAHRDSVREQVRQLGQHLNMIENKIEYYRERYGIK